MTVASDLCGFDTVKITTDLQHEFQEIHGKFCVYMRQEVLLPSARGIFSKHDVHDVRCSVSNFASECSIKEPFYTKQTSGCLIVLYYNNSTCKEAVSIIPV